MAAGAQSEQVDAYSSVHAGEPRQQRCTHKLRQQNCAAPNFQLRETSSKAACHAALTAPAFLQRVPAPYFSAIGPAGIR